MQIADKSATWGRLLGDEILTRQKGQKIKILKKIKPTLSDTNA